MTFLDYKKAVVAKLKIYRLEHEWSLQHMSRITGIAASALWKIENAKCLPTDLTVHKLRKTLTGLIDDAA